MPALISVPQDFGANCRLSATAIELWVLSDHMTAPYNPKNKNRCHGLHRHSAFFGTVEECMEDCCGVRPKTYNSALIDTCRSFAQNLRTKRSMICKTRR